MFVLQIPAVQTGIARYVAGRLQDSIDGKLEIGSIQIQPFNSITVRDVVLTDNNPFKDTLGRGLPTLDTLAAVGRLSATISPLSLIRKGRIELGKVEADRLLFQLGIEPGTGYGINLMRVLKIKSEGGSSALPTDTLFTVKNLNVTNSRYTMVNYFPTAYHPKHGLDYSDMDLTFDLKGHDVSLHDGRVFGVADYLHASEKCGYVLERVKGDVAVGRGHTNIRSLRIEDNTGSVINIPRLDFNYEDNPSAWSNFVNDVEMDIWINPSHLVFHTVGNYSGSTFYGCPLQADLTARFKGPVSDFRVFDFTFNGTECGASGGGEVRITGIPQTSKMRITGNLKDIRFTTGDLEKILADLGTKADLSRFAPGTEFIANGTMDGLLDDFKASLQLGSGIGGVRVEATSRNLTDKSKNTEFVANMSSDRFDLGRFLGSSSLGPASFTARARASLGSTLRARIEQFNASSINLLGYEYKDLALEGRMSGSTASVRLSSSDPNALLNFDGEVDWKTQTGRLELDIDKADLAALNLDKRGGKSLVSCHISGEQGLTEDEPARVSITGLKLTGDGGTYDIGDIEALARLKTDGGSLMLNSDILDAKYNGTLDFGALVSDIRKISTDRYLPAVFDRSGKAADPLEPLQTRNGSLSAIFHDTSALTAFFLPGLSISEGTAVNVDVDSEGRLMGYISAPSISYNNINASGLDLAVGNIDEQLSCTVGADLIRIGNITFDNAQFSADAASDILNLALVYDDAGLLDGGSELYVDAAFSRDSRDSLQVQMSTLPSVIRIKGKEWEISESELALNSTKAIAKGVMLSCEDQSISLDGSISPRESDTLLVRMHKLDLSLINSFTGSEALKVEGIADGDVTILSPYPSELGLSSDLQVTGAGINGRSAGDFAAKALWDDDAKAINLNLVNTYEGSDVLLVHGAYGTKGKTLSADADFNGFDVGVASPLLKSVLTEMSGTLTGNVHAGGSTSDLKLQSEGLQLRDVRGRVTYTNVAYTLNGTLSVDANNEVRFNNIGVKDDYDGLGILSGALKLGNFTSPRLEVNLDMRRLKAIDIPPGESKITVYGDLAISGNSGINGPFDALAVDADIRTSGPGTVNVPISSSAAASGSDLLVFVTPGDLEGNSEQKAEQEPPKPKSKFSVHALVNVSPEVTANIEIDKDSGHVLTAGGTGNVVFDLNTAKEKLFQLRGDYLIDKGKYLLNIPGIVSKEFDIKQGGSLKFNGDVMESTLDIAAIHNVKTSLSTLVVDSTAVSSRRNVECGLNITGKLRAPEVAFSIDVPDLDPNTKMKVDAALSTTDKVQKQFVALLLFGTFLPEENSGVVNGSNMIYSNVGEIVAGQLNNILQKLDIPVDFGFGYQQDNVGTDIFDVAVSTQLFNNRLVVGGSLGNRRYSTSKSANGDIVGDLDIELKIDRSGELRFKLFSHSADEFSSSLDFSQRNGLGFSYQKEYNHTRQFLRQLFTPRRKRNTEESKQDKEMKTIEIE